MEIKRSGSRRERGHLRARRPHRLAHPPIQDALDGKAVDWLEKVSDEQYQPRR